jgi:undecaprenyl-diphosphatase
MMLNQLFQILILGLIQGMSEWLPISSTAHLKLAEVFLGIAVTPLFNLVLHAGTLAVVVFFFRKEIKNILVALLHLDFKSESGRFIPLIIIAIVPTAVIGISYTQFLRDTLDTVPIIAITFLIGGTMVYTTKFAKETKDIVSFRTAFLLGIAQGFAIFPGLSRSGITISAALILGLKRPKAFKFSFLLSIPAIIGDLVYEAIIQEGQFSLNNLEGPGTFEILAGIIAAVVMGYLALRIVSKAIQGRKFHYFAFYSWALGIALLFLTMFVN